MICASRHLTVITVLNLPYQVTEQLPKMTESLIFQINSDLAMYMTNTALSVSTSFKQQNDRTIVAGEIIIALVFHSSPAYLLNT